jgi:peptidoglycan biosynthesis protein MviN/MurJ (putative lipid II flippase)
LNLALWGPINETFRTKFIFLKEKFGEETAIQKTTSLISFSFIISAVLCALIMCFPEPLVKIIAPGYYDSHLPELVFMIRIVTPSLLINQTIQLTTGILNSYQSFYMPEIAGLLSGFLNIVLLYVLAPVFDIYALAFSYYVSLFVLFIMIMFQIKRLKLSIKSEYFFKGNIRDVWPFISFALPFFLPYFAGQLNAIGEKSIANLLGSGTVSIVDYSRKFTDIPINALSSVLATMLLPVLTTSFTAQDQIRFQTEFKKVLQLGLIISTLVIGIFVINGPSIVSLLYGSNRISEDQKMLIGQLVQLYSLSAFSIFLYIIFGITLIASNRGKQFAFFGMWAQILMLAVNFFLYSSMNVFVFPVSLFIAHLLAAACMYVKLPFGHKEILLCVLRYSLLLAITVSVSFAIQHYLQFHITPIQSILLYSSIFFLVMLTFVFVLQVEEKNIISIVFKKIRPGV